MSGRGKPLILVVDDDHAVLNSLRFLLDTEGFDVRVFDRGAALVASPDLVSAACVIVDYRMPGVNGVEVAKALRGKGLNVPVILITGRVEKELFEEAAEAGIVRIVEKPLLDLSLVDVVRGAVRRPPDDGSERARERY